MERAVSVAPSLVPEAAEASGSAPARAAPPTAAPKPKTVDLRVIAGKAPSWLGVTNAAGQQLFWNILQPGQSQEFTDASKLDVIVGDAAAVDLVVNGHDLGSQGSSGQVFRASYNPASGG